MQISSVKVDQQRELMMIQLFIQKFIKYYEHDCCQRLVIAEIAQADGIVEVDPVDEAVVGAVEHFVYSFLLHLNDDGCTPS